MGHINGRLAEFKSCELLGPTPQKKEPTREARANVTFCPMVDIAALGGEHQSGQNVAVVAVIWTSC